MRIVLNTNSANTQHMGHNDCHVYVEICVYIYYVRDETNERTNVHSTLYTFYPNSSQNYPSIVICVCHTSDRHRTAFVIATNRIFSVSPPLPIANAIILSFFFRACAPSNICLASLARCVFSISISVQTRTNIFTTT